MDSSRVDETGDARICSIIVKQVTNEIEKELTTYHFIAMHVPNIFKLRFTYDGNIKKVCAITHEKNIMKKYIYLVRDVLVGL